MNQDFLPIMRSGVDRRSGDERRIAYRLDYFLDGGQERRKFGERRNEEERRIGWTRVSKWSSALVAN
jgi:hypothetical protein